MISLKDFEDYGRRSHLKASFEELERITDKWGFIRQMYMEIMPHIFEQANRTNNKIGINPYFYDWGKIFSPIEELAWNSIRSIGVPLYPQFPVFNYFIDFANPYARIGLELDGKEYHNAEKDRERDIMLYEKFDWKIFRIEGRETMVQSKNYYEIHEEYSDFGDEEERNNQIRHWLYNTSDGIIHALQNVYFSMTDDVDREFYEFSIEALQKHSLATFPIP